MSKLFEPSLLKARLVAIFKEMPVGREISFADVSAMVGEEVHSKTSAYHLARKRVLRDDHIVIESVPGVGFTRLNGASMVNKGYGTAARIRRQSARALLVANAAILQNLPPEMMAEASKQSAVFGIVMATTNIDPPKSNRARPKESPKADPFDAKAALASLKGKK